jgi:ubiquitin-protein ligase
MSTFFEERLKKELEYVASKNTPKRTIIPIKEGNLKTWRGHIKGPNKETHTFEIRLTHYPLSPPEIEWLTPISHPNIEPPKPEGNGLPCLPWLTNPTFWSPKTKINSIIEGLVFLLNNPNPADPMAHPKCLKLAIKMIRNHVKTHRPKHEFSKINDKLITAENILVNGDTKTAYQLVKQAGEMANLGKIEDQT